MERMTRHRRLNRVWWLMLLAAVLPWLLLVNVPEVAQLPPMTLFVIGLCGLLPTLKIFPHFKRALWALKPPFDAALEDQRWAALASAHRNGMLWASLPAWLAALASPLGLEGVAGLLLVTGSVLFSLVYRIPRQVLLP